MWLIAKIHKNFVKYKYVYNTIRLQTVRCKKNKRSENKFRSVQVIVMNSIINSKK